MASAASLAGNWMISTFAGSTPYCCRITLSRLTLAWVRPTTPMRRPASCWIFSILELAFLPFSGGGTHSTATFLRRVATACAFFGTSRSPRMIARSALPSASAAALGAYRDPQRHRAHREVICGADCTHQGKGSRQRDEHELALHRTRRRRRR